MAIYLHAFYPDSLPSKAAFMRCFKELGFPVSFEHGTPWLERQRGGLPMQLRGIKTGFELDTLSIVGDPEFADIEIDPRLTHCANIRYFSDAESCAAAVCFAATMAKLVNGAVYDPQAEQLVSLDRMLAWARDWLEDARQQVKRPRTLWRDVRRYLISLLKQRDDLVLAGTLLFLRPVRHLVRCAHLDPSRDGLSLKVSSSCMPLHGPACITGHALEQLDFEAWQPHFEPLLISRLAEDVFGKIGNVTTLNQYAALEFSTYGAPRSDQVLAGERDRAAAVVEEIEREFPYLGPAKRRHWEDLTKDIDATCARYHAQEAETVRKLKLERFWEPSQFPVELPATQRASRCAEPVFEMRPWPPAPAWLWGDMPRQPGEVRFAKDDVRHGDEIKLLVPLTVMEAEDRHRALEDYVLATRQPDNRLLTISHSTSWDRNDPEERPRRRMPANFYLSLDGGTDRVSARTSWTAFEHPGLIQIFRISVHRATKEIWLGYFDLLEGERNIHDWRSGEKIFSSSPLTDAEREICTFPTPGFGEYAIFMERIRALLRVAGYGELS